MDHGTYAGAQQHMKLAEPPCSACAEAKAEYLMRWRFKSGKQHHLKRCPECGSVFREHQCQGVRV